MGSDSGFVQVLHCAGTAEAQGPSEVGRLALRVNESSKRCEKGLRRKAVVRST
jgi:hypothetical protein